MNIQDDIIRILKEYRDVVCGGNSARAAAELKTTAPTFWRWVQGKSIPKVETLTPVFTALNARIALPTDKDIPLDMGRMARLERENNELKNENIRLQAQVDILRDMMQQQRPAPQQAQLPLPEPAKKAG